MKKTKTGVDKKREKKKHPSRLKVVINLWFGKAASAEIPAVEPIKTLKGIAEMLKKLELGGLFRNRGDSKLPRTDLKYANDARWYLTEAAKRGLIDRPYKARAKKAAASKPEAPSESPEPVKQPVAETAPVETSEPTSVETSEPVAETTSVEDSDTQMGAATVETVDTPPDDY